MCKSLPHRCVPEKCNHVSSLFIWGKRRVISAIRQSWGATSSVKCLGLFGIKRQCWSVCFFYLRKLANCLFFSICGKNTTAVKGNIQLAICFFSQQFLVNIKAYSRQF